MFEQIVPIQPVSESPYYYISPSNTAEYITMSIDPWSRPTESDVKSILEMIEKKQVLDIRESERLSLSVPAEVIPMRGNTIDAMTREVSRDGLGLLHRGMIQPGEVSVKMTTEDRTYTYRVLMEWCVPCERGMYMSGGRFLRDPEKDSKES